MSLKGCWEITIKYRPRNPTNGSGLNCKQGMAINATFSPLCCFLAAKGIMHRKITSITSML